MNKLILASLSPRRKELLRKAGVSFSILPSRINEETTKKMPYAIVKDLAAQKAIAVGKKLKDGIVIGADTIVVYKNHIIGKPKNNEEAIKILSTLSGTWHRVYTGLALFAPKSGRLIRSYDVSRVKIRKLTKQEIISVSDKHLDKAGAYAVQEVEDDFVEKIVGDYNNVVGLPVKKLAKMLKGFGIAI
ncbi:MAG: Maf family protein [Endomicrobiales bacterium]|nr:Maf family protein [Endomicrobiales bacterium]